MSRLSAAISDCRVEADRTTDNERRTTVRSALVELLTDQRMGRTWARAPLVILPFAGVGLIVLGNSEPAWCPAQPNGLPFDCMTIKERLHQAVETMSDEEATAALRTLAEASGDPVAWALDHAPLDDEAETEAERRAVADARADRERGLGPIPFDDVLAEFDGT